MIRSMTGYGAAERETAAGRLHVEIKSVNHDTFRLSLRVPSALDAYEIQIRDWLRAFIARGHVNCAIRLETPDGAVDGPVLRLTEARARQYHRVLTERKARLDLPGEAGAAFADIVADLLQKDPAARPQKAAELADRLAAVRSQAAA